MSARAAWRLQSLGFRRVYRYTAGKIDWFAHGLPREGEAAAQTWAGDLAWREVPTCPLDESIGDVRPRARAADWPGCVVVNEERVVLGLLYGAALEADAGTPVAQVMASGPRTIRPYLRLPDALKRMHPEAGDAVLVTTSDGVLLGLLRRATAEQANEQPSADGGHGKAKAGQ